MAFGIFGKPPRSQEAEQLRALRQQSATDDDSTSSTQITSSDEPQAELVATESAATRADDRVIPPRDELSAEESNPTASSNPLRAAPPTETTTTWHDPGFSDGDFALLEAIHQEAEEIIEITNPTPAAAPLVETGHKAPQIAKAPPPEKPIDTAKRIFKILVADDEPDIRTLMLAMLSESNYEIIQAVDGTQALQFWAEHDPDLVILDVQMPGVSGLDVCRQIKDRTVNSYTPIFLVTALDDPYSKVEGLKQGADDYITKPFFTEELQIKVASFLKIKLMTEELTRARDELAENEMRLTLKLYELGKM